MSTIWTPSGEYEPREEPEPARPGPEPPAAGREPSPEDLDAAMAEARAILSHPVLDHVAGHVMSNT